MKREKLKNEIGIEYGRVAHALRGLIVRVRVEYRTILIDVTKRDAEEVELEEGATVGDLIKTLVKKYGDDFEIGFKHARRRMVRVFVEVNEEPSTYPECTNIKLKDGDRVVITPLPLAWGG